MHPGNPPASEHAWQRAVIGAGAYYGLVLAATIAAAVAGPGGGDRVVAVAALAAMAPWYLVVGRPAARGVPVPARTVCYVLGLAVLLGIAQAADGWASLALFALCPQCFVLLPAWPATGAVAAFNLVPVLELAGDPGAALRAAGIAAGVVTFAATFGRWIIRIVEQSRQRAELVAALTAAQAGLARAEHEAGALAERQRLAAEIHDTLAQGFTSILMLLRAADACAAPQQARTYLSQAARTATENLAEARGLIAAQQPAALRESSLHEALGRLAGQLAEETGIAASCGMTGDVRWLPSAAEVTVLRCAQEALANVRRHSAAAAVTLQLDYRDDAIRLRVSDNGAGFDPAGQRGTGLAGMDQRVTRAGGSLQVRSSPGSGTTLTVELPRMIRVVIVDDHPVVRAGLRGMLAAYPGINVAGEASSAAEAVAAVRVHQPAVVLMDLRMPGTDGVQATRLVLARQPQCRVVILTTYDNDADILHAVEAGASGYLLKDATPDELARAIRAAAAGGSALAPSVAARLVSRIRSPAVLSPREVDVLRLVSTGQTNAQIGRALLISEATVKTHLLRAFSKLGVSDRTAAVTTALALGILPPPR